MLSREPKAIYDGGAMPRNETLNFLLGNSLIYKMAEGVSISFSLRMLDEPTFFPSVIPTGRFINFINSIQIESWMIREWNQKESRI